MLVSGFIDGNLIYILAFPFGCLEFANHLKTKVDKFFGGRHQAGRYLRSAEFSFRHYKNCRELRIVYLNEELMRRYRDNMASNFVDFLKNLTEEKIK